MAIPSKHILLVSCQNLTYAIPQLLITLRGRARVLPAHAFRLGRLGALCNVLSPSFVFALAIFVALPPQLPVSMANANYTPVVLVGLLGVILGMWFSRVGKGFEGPRIDWEALGEGKSV